MATLSRHIPVFHNVTSVSLTSSAKRSIASLLSPRAQYCVGEQLSVQVDMRNHMGELKSYGGDFILARIHSPNVMAAASGSVEDLRNGSYHVNFTLFWPGTVEASLLLVHPSEAVFSLWRARQQGYDKISYTGTFVNGSRQEKSLCNFRLSSNKTLCKYTDERGEEYYTCLKPPSLACESLTNFTSSYTQGSFFSDIENQLLKRDNIGVLIQNDFQAIEVLECDGATHNRSRLCEPGHISPLPSGYFLAKKWFSSSCHTGSFLSADSISRCLQGKTLYLRGDSTVRQWIEHLERTLKETGHFHPEKG
ncbi:NXPE family member 2-like [Amia ocellicauda]|uniref:NXPE family member 2-like n=1 Tax=Amia ocellicauda TaxID=2972642 RepID=UPI0034648401